MLPYTGLGKNAQTNENMSKQSRIQQQKTFEQSFRITEKINKLAGAPVFQRNLSPWTRRRGESIDKKSYVYDETIAHPEGVNDKFFDVRHQSPNNKLTETKMSDFLRKIQFTKRKRNTNYTKNNLQKNPRFIQVQSPQHSPNQNSQLQSDILKQLIMYPPSSKNYNQTSTNRQNPKNKNIFLNTKAKKWSNQKFSITSIQTFYDPYQNSPKNDLLNMSQSLSKRLAKISTDCQLTEEKAADLATLQGQMRFTGFRKNSMGEKSYRFRLNLKKQTQTDQDQSLNTRQQNNEESKANSKCFRMKRKSLSYKPITQPTFDRLKSSQNPQVSNELISDKQAQPYFFEPTYATPKAQAIKRIKHQSKKIHRLRIKTQPSTQNCDQSLGLSSKGKNMNQRQFLYKTFANYKKQNSLNITKTLKMNFCNQKVFNQKLNRILLHGGKVDKS